ncbi:mycothiol transferase [Nocardia asiatica]|uniref:mycothiol transferase n=1 Tax=Nocardia asiatica TaxID=209252 RepID=UPI003CC7F2DF
MPATTRRDTPPPRTGSSETEILRGFLDYLRTSIAAKVDGAPEPQVRTAAVPSGTNLLGLLDHLTFVERSMFLGHNVTDWQATFRAAPSDGVADGSLTGDACRIRRSRSRGPRSRVPAIVWVWP